MGRLKRFTARPILMLVWTNPNWKSQEAESLSFNVPSYRKAKTPEPGVGNYTVVLGVVMTLV